MIMSFWKVLKYGCVILLFIVLFFLWATTPDSSQHGSSTVSAPSSDSAAFQGIK